MSERFPVCTAREVIRVLRKHGFMQISQRGSHQKMATSEWPTSYCRRSWEQTDSVRDAQEHRGRGRSKYGRFSLTRSSDQFISRFHSSPFLLLPFLAPFRPPPSAFRSSTFSFQRFSFFTPFPRHYFQLSDFRCQFSERPLEITASCLVPASLPRTTLREHRLRQGSCVRLWPVELVPGSIP